MGTPSSLLPLVLVLLLPLAAASAGYFVWLWLMKRPPASSGRAIVPLYEPPAGLGPAEVAVLLERALHPRGLTALVLDLSLRGAIDVTESGGRAVRFRRTAGPSEGILAPYEKFLLDRIFAGSLTVDTRAAAAAVQHCQKELFGLIRASLLSKGFLADRFLLALLVLASAVVGGLVLGAGVFLAAGLFAAAGAAAVTIFMGQLAYAWLIRPGLSEKGERTLAEIEGFRMYLGAAEGNRIKWEELEENKVSRFTPYAIVFDISVTWSTRLQDITKALLENILI